MTADQVLQVADQHHRSGRAAEARQICCDVLARQPNHPDALHLLGILNAQAGRLDTAVDLLQRAVRVRPDFPQAWRNLGCVLVNQQKLDEATAAYTHLVELWPQDAVAHFALGLVLRDRGQMEQAIAAFSRAAELKGDDAEIHFQLGKALRGQGRLDEAIATYERAIALKGNFADAHNNLANALRDKGLLDEAIAHYRKALELKGDDAVTHFNLANAYSEMERFAEAVPHYERAIRLKADYCEAFSHLGAALAGLERFDEAVRSHQQGLALRPGDARAHEALGTTLLGKCDMNGALRSFRRALDLAPDLPGAWDGLGAASLAVGQVDEAAECFRRSMEIGQNEKRSHKNLVSIMDQQKTDPARVQQFADLLDHGNLPLPHRIGAAFALGKVLDDADRFDDAFARYAQANSLFRQWRAESGNRFDAQAVQRRVDYLIQTFTPEFFRQRRSWGNSSEVPVFIVGMPRSGTTLVEQIAATHPAVFGADELPDISRLAAAMARGGPAAPAQAWDARRIAQAGEAYLEHLRLLGPGAVRVTDKMPGNVFELGLISVLFPRARVIFCRRDPRDICLSCYFQWFPSSRLLYTYDLADCARQYLETERITSHWLKVLPQRMLEVRYEELVADQESQSRRLIEFLGLPWDPACLEFHKTKRTVTTASVWQVRQPIYNRSVGRWRNYERHLSPLLNLLNSEKADDALAPYHVQKDPGCSAAGA